MRRGVEDARSALHEGLLALRPQIERALHTRIDGLADRREALDPQYADGLRAAVVAALDYGLAVIEHGADRAPQIPVALLAQVRLAARNRIGLDTVLRRYFAGYTLLNDFLIGEAARRGIAGDAAMRDLLRSQAALFDRLLGAISEEYVRERESRPDRSAQRRRLERVERLLAGELVDVSELGYDFEATHLAAIASGTGAQEAIRELAARIDCRALLVPRDGETLWAWLGSRRALDAETFERLGTGWPRRLALALGEPMAGLAGWRLSHAQAKAALPVALRRCGTPVRYSEVALLASVLQDDLLATSLREMYLEPLASERDGGEMARRTLRAYFEADRNVSSAAAALGVSRQAVRNRLQAIDRRIGRPLQRCGAEVEAALRMEELDEFPLDK